MPDAPSLTPDRDFDAIASMSRLMYQAIRATHQRHPQWVKEKFRHQPWHEEGFQGRLTAKLAEKLGQPQDSAAVIQTAIKLLQTFVTPHFFVSAEFCALMEAIGYLTHSDSHRESNSCADWHSLTLENRVSASLTPPEGSATDNGTHPPASNAPGNAEEAIASDKDTGIAILLLDAENLNLDEETEEFLKTVCHYELQIKIAFANWQRMGKKDVELHARNYEMIHVPVGKDSADVKMATVGSSIFVHYPNAKEVLVCSSDAVMTHLCTTLQTLGLTVYLVRKHGKTVTIVNTQTHQAQQYDIGSLPEFYPIEHWLGKIQQLIREEQQRTAKQWIELSQISAAFERRYNLTLERAIAAHYPNKLPQNLFLEYPEYFAIHKLSDNSEMFVTVFDPLQPNSASAPFTANGSPVTLKTPNGNGAAGSRTAIFTTIFKTREELEKALAETIEAMKIKFPGVKVSTGTLGAEFKSMYGQKPSEIVTQLGLGENFLQFLLSCSTFSLKKKDKEYEVAIASTTFPDINSATELEQSLVKLIKTLILKSAGNWVRVSSLATEFYNQYGVPIKKMIHHLKIGGKFIQFLKSSPVFELRKQGKIYQVSLSRRGK